MFWLLHCSVHHLFAIFRFSLSVSQHVNPSSRRVCPPLAFPVSMQSWTWPPFSHTDLWTESSGGNARLPSHRLVCFPSYTTHREWSLTIFRHSGKGGKFSTQRLCNLKNIKIFHISFMGFSRMAARVGHVWSPWGGFVGRAQRKHSSGREWKCSVMVEHGRLVVIRDHLFLSEHKASAFSLRDRWISGSELDERIKGGHAHQWSALTLRRSVITCTGKFFSTIVGIWI